MLLAISGCSTPPMQDQDADMGADTPETLVEAFFTDFNQAIQDPNLDDPETRQIWALRLSNYFAPSERIDQRQALSFMLANFVVGSQQLKENHFLIVEILYSDITANVHGSHALVTLVDSELHLRLVRIEPNGTQTVQSDRLVPLSTMLGDYSEALPALLVNSQWYLTEFGQPMV